MFVRVSVSLSLCLCGCVAGVSHVQWLWKSALQWLYGSRSGEFAFSAPCSSSRQGEQHHQKGSLFSLPALSPSIFPSFSLSLFLSIRLSLCRSAALCATAQGPAGCTATTRGGPPPPSVPPAMAEGTRGQRSPNKPVSIRICMSQFGICILEASAHSDCPNGLKVKGPNLPEVE